MGRHGPGDVEATGHTDLLFMSGGGIMAHPGGPAAGVASIRQAWDGGAPGAARSTGAARGHRSCARPRDVRWGQMQHGEAARPRFGWYGDDFTGATDTLADLGRARLRALCSWACRRRAARGGRVTLDAIGHRRRDPRDVAGRGEDRARQGGRLFAALEVELLHYKMLLDLRQRARCRQHRHRGADVAAALPHALLPIIGGQPNLGRYCLFGNLFAAAGDRRQSTASIVIRP